jgi:hypothetical protein
VILDFGFLILDWGAASPIGRGGVAWRGAIKNPWSKFRISDFGVWGSDFGFLILDFKSKPELKFET